MGAQLNPSTDRAPEVVVIGDVMMDHQYWVREMPRPGGDAFILKAESNSGGSAANTAIALCSLGVACSFCGCVGEDPDGRELVERMRRRGLDLSCMMAAGGSGYTLTVIEDSGERTMFSKRCESRGAWRLTPKLREHIAAARVLLLSGYLLLEPEQAEFCVQAAAVASRQGKLVMLDASPMIGAVDAGVRARVLGLTQVLLPNRQELVDLTGKQEIDDAVRQLLEQVPCIGLKLGGEGSLLAARAGFAPPGGAPLPGPVLCRAASRQVKALDTTGAGDAFNAGFIASLLRDDSPQHWLESGNDLAARVIANRGAVTTFQGTWDAPATGES